MLCLFFSVDGASHPRFDWETIAKLALAAIVIFGVAWFRQYGFKKINFKILLFFFVFHQNNIGNFQYIFYSYIYNLFLFSNLIKDLETLQKQWNQ